MAQYVNYDSASQNGLYTTEYWSNRLQEMIKLEASNFVFSTLGKTMDIPKNSGTRTLSLRRYNSLPVGDHKLSEGVAPAPLLVEGQKVQGTIDQFGAYIKETDWVKDIHIDDIKTIYQPELARHAAEVKERNIMSKFSEASEYFCDATSPAANDEVDNITADDVLTFQDIRLVDLTMKNYRRSGHPKFGGHAVVVVHPNVMQDLLDDQDLEDKMLVPGNDNSPIKIGNLQRYMVYGFYLIESHIAEVAANSSDVNVYTSYLLGKDPYVIINLGSGGVEWKSTGFSPDKSDVLGQFATFGYKMWTGAKVIDPIAITKIYSASAFDAALADFSTDPIGRTAAQLMLPATLTLSDPGTVVTTKTITLSVTGKNGDALSALGDAFYVTWASATTAKATIAGDGLTAVITGVADGTSVISASLYKRTIAGDTLVGTVSRTVTVDVA